MTASPHRPYPGLARSEDADENWPLIGWVNTDPRRAPLRNDAIDGLQKALPVALTWLVFLSDHDALVRSFFGAIAVGLVFFALGFVFSWAQMITARRPGRTVRSPRSKIGIALVEGLLIGVVVVAATSRGASPATMDLALAIGSGIVAAAIVLGLERFAVDVPAANDVARVDVSRIEYR